MLCLALSTAGFASPYELSYGGRLTETSGKPVSGPVNLRVTFFRSVSGNDQVAVTLADFTGITLQDGIFQIPVSLSAADFHLLFNGVDHAFIQVEDLTHAVTYPRQKFSAVPYALKVPVDGESITYNLNGELALGNGSNILKLPNTAGAANKVLKSDGAGGLVWADDLSGGGAGTVTSTEIQDGTITNDDISATAGISPSKVSGLGGLATKSAVDSSEITDGSVTGTDIASGTITDANIHATAGISYLKISGLGGAASKNVGTGAGEVAAGNHGHAAGDINGLGTAATKDVGAAAGQVAAGDHSHADATTAVAGFMSAGDKVRLNAAVVPTDTGTVSNTMIADNAVTNGKVANGAINLAKLSATICNANEILKMNSAGTALTCAIDAGGGSYSAKSSDYTVTTSDNDRLLDVTNQTTISLPAAATTGFRVTVKRSGAALVRIMPSGAETIDGQNVGVMLLTANASVILVSTGTAWVIAGKDGTYARSSAFADLVCGGASDSCYDDTTAKAAGYAITPSGKPLEYVPAAEGFKIWKEVNGSRILKANGLDQWQMKLNLNGKGHSAADFTAWMSIVGRVCPPNVYVDDSNKFTTGNCLYYASEPTNSSLDGEGTSQTTAGMIGLDDWTTHNGGVARWYVGNIEVCSRKGMRLPTLFETTTTDTAASSRPTGDGSPTYAQASGVPSFGVYTWTATSFTSFGMFFWTWRNVLAKSYNTHGQIGTFYAVRCVLP